MTQLNAQTTVGELVKAQPGRARVFERLKIDYCCGGKIPLAEACAKRGIDPEEVLEQLRALDHATPEAFDADTLSLTELAQHIVDTHHAYLREEMPRLDFMTRKVAAVHGDSEPRLREIRVVFEAFQQELAHHLLKEENVLFPLVREIDQAESFVQMPGMPLAAPIAQMEREHESAGNALEQLRELTDDFTPPDWACNTYRAMFQALHQLEWDMHQHVHKENNVLFPKALERAAQLQACAV
ncbi:MAG: iron-sulfur cluster repair di-iron protein [Verrucomicrobiota bacterium JB022]|nr:iron-sulfur cluster repair di-iron protein [Verrucomicrobiota bacterium JB022]